MPGRPKYQRSKKKGTQRIVGCTSCTVACLSIALITYQESLKLEEARTRSPSISSDTIRFQFRASSSYQWNDFKIRSSSEHIWIEVFVFKRPHEAVLALLSFGQPKFPHHLCCLSKTPKKIAKISENSFLDGV